MLEVNQCMRTRILGSESKPVNWKVPLDDDKKNGGKQVGTLTLDNVRMRKVIESLDMLIDICIFDDNMKELWKEAIVHYQAALKLLISKEDLLEHQYNDFQYYIDKFAQIWVGKLGQAHEGISNYIHMLISGHIHEYLVYWKNLYVHSQQGWEALNNFVKKYHLRRTNRGGTKVNGNRLKGVARWLLRRLVWMTGVDYETILQVIDDNEDGELTLEWEDDINSMAEDSINNTEESFTGWTREDYENDD